MNVSRLKEMDPGIRDFEESVVTEQLFESINYPDSPLVEISFPKNTKTRGIEIEFEDGARFFIGVTMIKPPREGYPLTCNRSCPSQKNT